MLDLSDYKFESCCSHSTSKLYIEWRTHRAGRCKEFNLPYNSTW